MTYAVRFLAPLFLLHRYLEGLYHRYGKNDVALLQAPFNHTSSANCRFFKPDTTGQYDCSFSPSSNSRHKNELPFKEGKYGEKKKKNNQEKEKVEHSAGVTDLLSAVAKVSFKTLKSHGPFALVL